MATWPTRTPYQVLSGAQATALGRDLYDRADVIKGKPFGFPVPLVSTAAGALTTVLTRAIRVPNFARGGDKLRLSAYVACSGGGTASFRWIDSGGTNGTTATTASSTGALLASDITIPDDTWAGTVRTFSVQGAASAGTASICTDGNYGPCSLVGNAQVVAP